MADLNNAVFTGRLTRDAETQAVGAKGTIVTKFAIANNTGFGQYARTSFINVEVWGRAGEAVLQYLKKGKQVGVSGVFENRKYTDRNGIEKDAWTLTASSVTLLADAGGTRTIQATHEEPDYNQPGVTF